MYVGLHILCHCEEPFGDAQSRLCDEAIKNLTDEIATACFAGLAMTFFMNKYGLFSGKY
jgi:hypothetical protein